MLRPSKMVLSTEQKSKAEFPAAEYSPLCILVSSMRIRGPDMEDVRWGCEVVMRKPSAQSLVLGRGDPGGGAPLTPRLRGAPGLCTEIRAFDKRAQTSSSLGICGPRLAFQLLRAQSPLDGGRYCPCGAEDDHADTQGPTHTCCWRSDRARQVGRSECYNSLADRERGHVVL